MRSRFALPKASRGRSVLVGTTVVVLSGVLIALVFATRAPGPPTASLGLPFPGSLPVVARFPATTTTVLRRPTATPVPTSATTTTTRHPATTAPLDLVATPTASGPPETSAPVPVPVPTTGPRYLMAPAVTATLPPAQPPLGASAVTWTAPVSLDIAAGATAPLSVTAHNPTDRPVDLPNPLSCTPRLDHAEMCGPEVQRIAAHASASATYTIDAQGIVPGAYTLSIEGVLLVAVTVS